VTTAYQIGLMWDEGVEDGGTPIIYYSI
jgi:hypothetical protein